METELDASRTSSDRIAARTAHLDRMKKLAGRIRILSAEGRASSLDAASARYSRLQAEQGLARSREVNGGRDGDRPKPAVSSGGGASGGGGAGLFGGGFGGDATRTRSRLGAGGDDQPGDQDPRSRVIAGQLDETIDMHFPSDTPLDDVLKYIKSATRGPGRSEGIPVYVDPIALQEAEKSLASTVIIDLSGVPLRVSLRLVLRQLGLTYKVEDGVLMILADSGEETPIKKLQERALRGEMSLEEMDSLLKQLKLIREIQKHEARSVQ
jgi:hypothetical protein